MPSKITSSIAEAVLLSDKETVKKILQTENVSLIDFESAACFSTVMGELDILKYVLEKNPSIGRDKNFIKYKIFSVAVDKRNLDIVKFLVENNYINILEPYYVSSRKITVIHLAAELGYMEMLKYFIEEKHADVNILNAFRETPVFSAARSIHHDIIKYLVEEKNADLRLLNLKHEHILYAAARNADLLLMKYVLDVRKVKIGIDHQDEYGRTLLHRVSIEPYQFKSWQKTYLNDYRIEMIKYLVEEKHADVNIANMSGETPLHIASHFKLREICEYLIDHGAKVNIKNNYGEVPNIEFMKDTFQRRNRRSVSQFTTGTSNSKTPFIPPIFNRIQRISGDLPRSIIRLAGENRPDAVDFVNHSEFHNFLMLAQMLIRNSRKTINLDSNYLSSPSPQEILLNKIDPIAIEAIHSAPHF